jgi:hypothetical protein
MDLTIKDALAISSIINSDINQNLPTTEECKKVAKQICLFKSSFLKQTFLLLSSILSNFTLAVFVKVANGMSQPSTALLSILL